MARKSTKTAAKTTEAVVAEAIEPKAEEIKTEKVAEPKAAETEAEQPKAARKAPAKKTATRTTKAAAKAKEEAPEAPKAKEEAAVETVLHVQYAGKAYSQEDLLKIAKDVWEYDLNRKPSELKNVEMYVKPEENKVYYVMNGEISGSFAI